MNKEIITEDSLEKEKIKNKIKTLLLELAEKTKILKNINKNDISENSYLTAALEEKENIEKEIKYNENLLNQILTNELKKTSKNFVEKKVINLNSNFELLFLDTKEIKKFRLVVTMSYYDINDGYISVNSALGKKLLGASKSDILLIDEVSEPYKVEVLKIF